MGERAARVARILLGERPRALLRFLAPTAGAVCLDLLLRGRTLAGYALQGKAIYGSSLLIGAAFWALPTWWAARLLARERQERSLARSAVLVSFFGLWVLPLATLAYGGQALYRRVFHAYMGRDTLRLGIALRGTVGELFAAWGSPLLLGGLVLAGVVVTLGIAGIAWRASSMGAHAKVPLLLVLTFFGALVCFWTDQVDSRFLQAATPDVCFVHGVVHAIRVTLTGKGALHQGMSLRTPAPLPPLRSSRAGRPNVLVVLTESVRADATCSDPPPACRARFLDDVVPDRLSLGELTSQTPNTFSACMMLWTGLAPTVSFREAHTAPVLWELARSVGYRTAYVTSQNPLYEDFGAFVRRAGIDAVVTATDLGALGNEQLGAPDERATEEMLRFVERVPPGDRYFAVLHLSNTHAPYRDDPGLRVFEPSSSVPLDVDAFHNHYRNSVLLQERTVAAFLRSLRAQPLWEDTVVLFLSDPGEEFAEHGGLYHNHSLWEEGLRVPGWAFFGAHALGAEEREAILSYAGRRTYIQDVHATLVDLLGLYDDRARLPLAGEVAGRSLLRPSPGEPIALLATSTSVWEPDDARFGAMQGEHALLGLPSGGWSCYDLASDPGEEHALDAAACGPLAAIAEAAFGHAAP
jgi:hypothetical protein